MRHFLGIEQRAAARELPVRGVAVPGEAGIRQADVFARAVADVRDQQYLGIARQQVFLDDVDLELAETAAEPDLLFFAQLLVAEEHDDVVVEVPLDLGKDRVVDRLRQIEDDLGAAGGIAWPDRDRHGRQAPQVHRRQTLALKLC